MACRAHAVGHGEQTGRQVRRDRHEALRTEQRLTWSDRGEVRRRGVRKPPATRRKATASEDIDVSKQDRRGTRSLSKLAYKGMRSAVEPDTLGRVMVRVHLVAHARLHSSIPDLSPPSCSLVPSASLRPFRLSPLARPLSSPPSASSPLPSSSRPSPARTATTSPTSPLASARRTSLLLLPSRSLSATFPSTAPRPVRPSSLRLSFVARGAEFLFRISLFRISRPHLGRQWRMFEARR